MKLQSLQKSIQNSHLKVIKNTTRKLGRKNVSRIYINTLIPNFSYTDNSGKTITSYKSVLL